jgi:sporulation protein YlmC with PRC-barrel domain
MKHSKNSIIGKTVMSETGVPIGIIKKSLVDSISGKITSLLIDPSHTIDLTKYNQNKQGDIVLPIDFISPVRDVFVFEKDSWL